MHPNVQEKAKPLVELVSMQPLQWHDKRLVGRGAFIDGHSASTQ
jgi:hypothetical protein